MAAIIPTVSPENMLNPFTTRPALYACPDVIRVISEIRSKTLKAENEWLRALEIQAIKDKIFQAFIHSPLLSISSKYSRERSVHTSAIQVSMRNEPLEKTFETICDYRIRAIPILPTLPPTEARFLLQFGRDRNVASTALSIWAQLPELIRQSEEIKFKAEREKKDNHGQIIRPEDEIRYALLTEENHLTLKKWTVHEAAESISAILKLGRADLAYAGENGVSPFHHYVRNYTLKDCVDHFLAQGQSIEARDAQAQTALLHAVIANNRVMLEHLLRLGAQVNVRNGNWKNSLHIALVAGHTQIANILLSRKINVLVKDGEGFEALDYARERRRSSVEMEALVRKITLIKFQTSCIGRLRTMMKICCARKRAETTS